MIDSDTKDDPAARLLERMRDRPQHDRDAVAELLDRAIEKLTEPVPVKPTTVH